LKEKQIQKQVKKNQFSCFEHQSSPVLILQYSHFNIIRFTTSGWFFSQVQRSGQANTFPFEECGFSPFDKTDG